MAAPPSNPEDRKASTILRQLGIGPFQPGEDIGLLWVPELGACRPDQGGASARDFVGGDAHADAQCDQQAEVVLMFATLGQRLRVIR